MVPRGGIVRRCFLVSAGLPVRIEEWVEGRRKTSGTGGIGDRQHLLALAPADHAHQKARLQAEELPVLGQVVVVDVHRVAVPDIAVRIEVARPEHRLPGGVGHRHLEPDEPLGVESGRDVVAVRSVVQCDPERQALRAGLVHHEFAQPVPVAQQPKPLPRDLIQEFEVVPEDVGRVVAVVRLGPAGRKPGSLRNVRFERVGSPARFVVEAQPLPERGQLPGFGVVRKYAGMDDRVIRAGEHVVRPFAPARRLVSHARGRSFGVAGGDARLLAHMAVLARRALPGGRRVFELAEGFLQPEPVREVDVVAGTAEPGA